MSDVGPSVRFSVVSAAYNVARFLPDFIASIEAQRFDLDRVQVVVVDDGSTDDTPALLREWQQRRPGLVEVVTQANGGQASARNAGLEVARGSWVTFTDPDDILEPDYLTEVDRCLREHPEVDLVGTARIVLDDATGERSDSHPLRGQFRRRNPAVRLGANPGHFYGSAPCAFFRRERIEELGLRFDAAIRPHFEDGFFCCAYLLSYDDPVVGFVGSAHYVYRRRSDASSTLQRSLHDPARFTTAPRLGYLGIVELAQRRHGEVPDWLQSHLIYELSWYFSIHDRQADAVSATGETAAEYHRLVAELLGHLDPALIEGFSARRLKPVWRDVLLHGYDEQPWHQDYVLVSELDAARKLVRLSYRYHGPAPQERIWVSGRQQPAAYGKVRAIDYHDQVLLQERIAWVPATGALAVELDGRRMELRFAEPGPTLTSLTPTRIRAELTPAGDPPAAVARNGRDRWLERLAASAPVRRRFENAWVLMDRVHDANDSAEVLFRYLRKHRRKINAWFVVEAGTPDYRRLKAEGFRRVLPHGSLLWKLAMLNARHLISSHADLPIVAPPALEPYGDPGWRFTFLQHGVIKDDLSAWLNPKPIQVFVTSTSAEHESIVGDQTRYVYTDKEVVQTGLPRFDRLYELGRQVGPADRDLVLVAPTWRNWLVPPLAAGSQRRSLGAQFLASDFVQRWLEFLRSAELATACRERDLTLAFLPHPNLQSALPDLDLPAHVQALDYESHDVGALFARAAVLVTDYSSIAFNAAYMDRPVVYYQFDADRVADGGHVGRRGYFDYGRDGFGPVTTTADQAVAAVLELVRGSRSPSPVYAERVAAAFPDRDGGCCARVTDAIVASARPYR